MTSRPSSAPAVGALSRIGNGVVIALIALSVLAQVLVFAIAWRGGAAGAGLSAASTYLNMAILPGTALAFVKLILMVIRRTWRSAAIYLLILLLPFLGIATTVGVAVVAAPRAADQVEPENEEYLAGRNWARANSPDRQGECRGSHEFNRGCRAAISGAWHEKFQAGREWARQHRPRRPSECQGELNFRAGCQGYLLEQVDYFNRYAKPVEAPPSDYEVARPANGEECAREVNAIFEVEHALTRQQGFEDTDHRAWRAELQGCRHMAWRAETELLTASYHRLDQAVNRLKAGTPVPEEDQAQIQEDQAAVAQVGEQPYRTSYLRLFDEYQERLTGRYREPVVEYPKLSCDEYRAKIDGMRELDRQRSARMRELAAGGGGAERAQLNQARIDMLWDWKLYTDGAKANGCQTETN